jgi:ABC-type multidrug transport system fused ATPase/permease subunit
MTGMIRLFKSDMQKALRILTTEDKRKMYLVVGLNVVLGFVDLIGVAAVGVIGALAVAGFGASVTSPRIQEVLSFLGLGDLSFQAQVAILGTAAGSAFVLRTIASIYINRRIMFFFSRKGASIAIDLYAKVLGQSLTGLRKRTSQEYAYLFGEGVTNLTVGTLATAATITSDLILLIILITGVLVVDFTSGLTLFVAFGMLALILNKITSRRARNIGKKDANLSTKTYAAMYESILGFKELYAGSLLGASIGNFQKLKNEHSEILAQRQFLPILSKYVIEGTVILLALSVAAFQFLSGSAGQAVAALSLFLGAGSRIAPAILRIQQALVTIRASSKSTELTLALIKDLENVNPQEFKLHPLDLDHFGFDGKILLQNVQFKYKNQSSFALNEISLNIPAGSFVAIIGPSGSGKSTLVDAMLGLLELDDGTITISGVSPDIAVNRWPGAIAYVPQSIVLTNQSILQNVLCGHPPIEKNTKRAVEVLAKVHLTELVETLPNGFHSEIGENGGKLSGGQAQRLGLARALFQNPKILILDEATSALDGETESLISEMLDDLHGSTTIVTIAHRLNTVKKADIVLYLENSKIGAVGTFEYVASRFPGLDSQVNETKVPKD